ncbi:PLP-dependent transferase [Trichoderma barbatum]
MAHPFVADSHILHRTFADNPLRVVATNGIRLVLESGQEILDGSAGPSVSCLGHSRPDVAQEVARQLTGVPYVYSGARFTSNATEELASHLLRDRPGGLSKAIFVNSGSEATDAALKLAFQYWREAGQPQKRFVIARKQSYHGNTIGALCVSGHDSRRTLYKEWMSTNVRFVDPCFAYRFKRSGETDEKYVQRLSDQLESEILDIGPKNVAAFIAETVSGTTLGCATATPGYFQAVRALCDKYDILLILDEIMCGMGKTGTIHAWQQEDIRGPDIQTIGKALGGGFIPLSGVLLHQRIFDVLALGSGTLAHGHTFQAHPAACAAALTVQKVIEKDNLLQKVQTMGDVLGRLLRQEVGPLPLVGDIRGRGLFWAVEFMAFEPGRVPLPREAKFCDRVVNRALDLGLNILGNLGVTGDVYVDHVIISPPYIVTEDELRDIVMILVQAIKDTTQEVRSWIDGCTKSATKLNGINCH